MQIGIIGLGRMGNGIASRLLKSGHEVVVHNRSVDKMIELEELGAITTSSLAEMVEKLMAPRIIWLYLPSGGVTRSHILELKSLLQSGDCILDGGNSRYTDTLSNADLLAEHGIALLDVGTSGGVVGKEKGYCLMVGGDETQYTTCSPLWSSVAQPNGFERVGPVGSGHYVKMIHNAIEYGMMQSYGEGMELLSASRFSKDLDMKRITSVWQNGSIIQSFLGGLLHQAIEESPQLQEVGNKIDDNGEGKWAIEEGLDLGIPTPVISSSLYARYQSRKETHFSNKVVAILRKKFGGHAIEQTSK